MLSPALFKSLLAIITSAIVCVDASPMLDARQAPAGWSSIGCYSDSTSSRTLQIASFTSVDAMTIEACTAFCAPTPYRYAGVEFGRECYCDNNIESPGVITTDGGCNMACTGNTAEICGGANRINIFHNLAVPFPPPPSTTSATTTSATTTANPPPATPTIKRTAGTFEYKGCFQDVVNTNQRTLANGVTVSGGVNVEGCTTACKAAGFPLAGLEFGQECWCDTYMELVNVTPDSDCNKPCQADASELCGNGNRLAVYQDTTATVPDPQQCLPNFQILHHFNLQAVPSPNGGAPITIGALEVAFETLQDGNTIAYYLLTEDNSGGITNDDLFLGTTGNPNVNLFWLDHILGASLAPTVGGAQIFAQSNTLALNPYDQYCPKPNPQSLFGPFIGPAVLSVNGHIDEWALCPNITAGGNRIDVVFSPISTSPDYTLSACQSVILQMH